MEHIPFENKYEITKALMRRWSQRSRQKVARHWPLFLLMMTVLYGVIAVLSLFAVLIYGDQNMLYPAILSLLLLSFSLARPYISSGREFKRLLQLSGETRLDRTIHFGDKLTVTTGNSTLTFSYGQIRFVDETDESFRLWIDGALAFIMVYKNSFTVGDTGAFSTFIKEKCAESEMLWSKRELYRKVLKRILPRMIIGAFMIIFLLIYVWISAFHPNTIAQVVNRRWNYEIQVICSAELPNGAVAFGYDGADRIYGILFGKRGNHYSYIDAHSYSITSINDTNRAGGWLFESQEGLLPYSGGEGKVVYGVADAGWWNNAVTESEKEKYTTSPFQCADADYVLYYRLIDGEVI